MIAAIAAAVSAVSTLRLLSGPRAGLSGTLAFAGVNPADELEVGAGVGAAAGPLKATGCAKPDGEVVAPTGALLTGAFCRPTE
jgi:hypothetical protein